MVNFYRLIFAALLVCFSSLTFATIPKTINPDTPSFSAATLLTCKNLYSGYSTSANAVPSGESNLTSGIKYRLTCIASLPASNSPVGYLGFWWNQYSCPSGSVDNGATCTCAAPLMDDPTHTSCVPLYCIAPLVLNAAGTGCTTPPDCPSGQTASISGYPLGWFADNADGSCSSAGVYQAAQMSICVANGSKFCLADAQLTLGMCQSGAVAGRHLWTGNLSGPLNGSTCSGPGTAATMATPPPPPDEPCKGEQGTVNGVKLCIASLTPAAKAAAASAAAALAASNATAAALAAGKTSAEAAAAGAAASTAAAAASNAGATSATAAAAGSAAGSAAALGSTAAQAAGSATAAAAQATAAALANGSSSAVLTASVAAAREAATNAVTAAIAAGQTSQSAAAAGAAAGAAAAQAASLAASIAGSNAATAAAAAGKSLAEQSAASTAAATASATLAASQVASVKAAGDAALAAAVAAGKSAADTAAAVAAAQNAASAAAVTAAGTAASEAAAAAGKSLSDQQAAAAAAATLAAQSLNDAKAATAAALANAAAEKSKNDTKPTNAITEYCAENPAAALCKEAKDSTFSGSCGSDVKSVVVPACDGDAVSCAIAASSFQTNCALLSTLKPDDAASARASAALDGTDGINTDKMKTDATKIQIENFSQAGRGWGRSCPADPLIDVNGHSFTLPLSKICTPLQLLANAAVAITLLASLLWVLGSRNT